MNKSNKKKYTGFVSKLAEDEVFVFGSNLSGFHGAGSAGYAMRGDSRNNWRDDTKFCDIVYGRSTDKLGRWAVFGIGRGYQTGKCGRSYAVATVERPGKKGCVDGRFLLHELVELCQFAKKHPELKFLVVKLGATRSEGGFSYFGVEYVHALWALINKKIGVPNNITLPKEQEVRFSSEEAASERSGSDQSMTHTQTFIQ